MPTPSDPVVYAVGDGATGGSDAAILAAAIHDARPDALLYLGDVYESGTAEEFQRNYAPSWGQLDPVVLPVRGNHDAANYDSGFRPYFSRQSRLPLDRPWYARGLGGWLLLMLDSESPSARGSEQHEWVAGQLEPPREDRRVLACWHRPRFCSGSHGDAADLADLWDLVAPHCAAVLSGHAHNLQHFRPDSTGCRQLVSGAGGRSLYADVPDDPRLEWGNASGYGAARLTLGASLGVEWVDERGRALWQATIAT